MRKVLGIEYKGTRYLGWQKQKKFITVQGELEKALKKFLSKNKVETFAKARIEYEGRQRLPEFSSLALFHGLFDADRASHPIVA